PGRRRAAGDGAEAGLTERCLERHGGRLTGRWDTGECGSTDRARPAGRDWPGGAEGAAAVTRRGLPNSAADVEWRHSPRSSSDPNKGSWRGRCPAGYEVGEGTPCRAELHLGTQEGQHARERDDDDQHPIEQT